MIRAFFAAKKAKLIPVALVGIMASLGASHFFMYQRGAENERIAASERVVAALEEQRKNIERIHNEELAIIEKQFESEQVIVEKIREVEIFVPTPMCEDLGSEWLREYNRAIGAATDITENP